MDTKLEGEVDVDGTVDMTTARGEENKNKRPSISSRPGTALSPESRGICTAKVPRSSGGRHYDRHPYARRLYCICGAI